MNHLEQERYRIRHILFVIFCCLMLCFSGDAYAQDNVEANNDAANPGQDGSNLGNETRGSQTPSEEDPTLDPADSTTQDGGAGTPQSDDGTKMVAADPGAKKSVGEIQGNLSKFCFVCPIAAHIFTAAMLYPPEMMDKAGDKFMQLLAIILALWIMWQVIKILMPFGASNGIANIGNSIFVRVMLVLFVVGTFTASGYNIYWEYVYKPVVSGGIDFGYDIITEGSPKDSLLYKARYQGSDPDKGDRGCYATNLTALEGMSTVNGEPNEKHLMKDKLECQIHTLQRAFSYGLAVGIHTFSSYGSWDGKFSGGLLIIMFILPILLFSVMVIDALIKWTVISILTPVLAGCACFPSTRKFAVLGYKVVLESALNFIIAAIIAVLLSHMVHYAVIRLTTAESALAGAFNAFPEVVKEQIENAEAAEAAENGTPEDGVEDGVDPAISNPNEPVAALPIYEDYAASGAVDEYTHARKETLEYYDTLLQADGSESGTLINELPMGSGWTFPIDANDYKTMCTPGTHGGQKWGACRSYCTRRHGGIDIGCDAGAKQLSMKPGVILVAENVGGGCGNMVKIDHQDGYETKYCHLSKILSSAGQTVGAGAVVGLIGNTGIGTGPHMHLEIRLNGGLINPTDIVYNQAEGAVGVAGAGSPEKTPPVSMANVDWWLLFATGLISKHSMKNIAPMTSTILGSPALGGIGMAIFGSMAGLLGSGLKQGGGAVAGVATPFAQSMLPEGMANALGIDKNATYGNTTAPIPRTEDTAAGYGPRYEEGYGFMQDFELSGMGITAEQARAMQENPEEAAELLETMTLAMAGMGMGTVAALAGGNINAVQAGNEIDAEHAEAIAEAGEINDELLDEISSKELKQADRQIDEMTEQNIALQEQELQQNEVTEEEKQEEISNLQERVQEQIEEAKQAINDMFDAAENFNVVEFAINTSLGAAIMVGSFAADKVGSTKEYFGAMGKGLSRIPGSVAASVTPGKVAWGGAKLTGLISLNVANNILEGAGLGSEIGMDNFTEALKGKSVGRQAVNASLNLMADAQRRAGQPTATTQKEQVDRLAQLADDDQNVDQLIDRLNKFNDHLQSGAVSGKEKRELEKNAHIALIQATSMKMATTVAGTQDTTGRHDYMKDRIEAMASANVSEIRSVKEYKAEMDRAVEKYMNVVGEDRQTQSINAGLLAAAGVASIAGMSSVAGSNKQAIKAQMKSVSDNYKDSLQATSGTNTRIDNIAAHANRARHAAGDVFKKQEWEKTTATAADRNSFNAYSEAEKREMALDSITAERPKPQNTDADAGNLVKRGSIFDDMQDARNDIVPFSRRAKTDILDNTKSDSNLAKSLSDRIAAGKPTATAGTKQPAMAGSTSRGSDS